MLQDSSPLHVLRDRSLATEIRSEIETLILNGSLPAGERLNENMLAAKYRVSRGPVREACRALVEAGLLELIPNRGVFVRQVSLEQALEAYEVRAGLFGLAGRLAAERISEGELGDLSTLVDEMGSCVARREPEAYYTLNLDLHALIVAATRNQRLVASYNGMIKELHLFRAKSLGQSGTLAASNAEHGAMVAALAARDTDRAYDAHYRHVMNAKERVLRVAKPAD